MELTAPNTLTALPGWDELEKSAQSLVMSETQALGESLVAFGMSRLAIGEHLVKIQKALKPKKKMFGLYLNFFNLRKSSAYNYIRAFELAKNVLPEPALRVAMARNLEILGANEEEPLGKYTKAVKRLPPPKTSDARLLHQWVDQIHTSTMRREANEVPRQPGWDCDPETLLRECYRFVSGRFQKLPRNHKNRQRWMERLVGMMLTSSGVSTSLAFNPEAIPDGFRAQVGRPKLELAA